MIESFFLFCQHSQRFFFFVTFVTGGKSSRSTAALSLGFENCHYFDRIVTGGKSSRSAAALSLSMNKPSHVVENKKSDWF